MPDTLLLWKQECSLGFSWDHPDGGGYYSCLLEPSSRGLWAQGGHGLRTTERQCQRLEGRGRIVSSDVCAPLLALGLWCAVGVGRRSTALRASLTATESKRGREREGQHEKRLLKNGGWHHPHATSRSGRSKLAWRGAGHTRDSVQSADHWPQGFWRWI